MLDGKLIPCLKKERFEDDFVNKTSKKYNDIFETFKNKKFHLTKDTVEDKLKELQKENSDDITVKDLERANSWLHVELSKGDFDQDQLKAKLEDGVELVLEDAKQRKLSQSIYRGLPVDEKGQQKPYDHEFVLNCLAEKDSCKLLNPGTTPKSGNGIQAYTLPEDTNSLINLYC